MDTNLLAVATLIVVALDLRLHQRIPRRRELDRDRRLHPRPDARARRSSGPRSSISSPHSPSAPRSRQTVGSGLVDITVVSFSVIFAGLIGAIVWDLITWYYGLPTSSSHALIGGYAGAAVIKAGWTAIIAVGMDQDADLHRPGAADWHDAGLPADGRHHVDLLRHLARPGRSLVPAAAAGLGGRLQPRPRRQRRAEDDGHHRRRAVRGRLSQSRRRQAADSVLGDHGRARRDRARHAVGRLADHPHDGVAHHQARSRLAVSPPRPPGRSRCSPRPTSACRSAPRTRSPAPSSASGRSGGCRPCAGVWPGEIVWAWVLTIPAAAFIAAVVYWVVAHTIAP